MISLLSISLCSKSQSNPYKVSTIVWMLNYHTTTEVNVSHTNWSIGYSCTASESESSVITRLKITKNGGLDKYLWRKLQTLRMCWQTRRHMQSIVALYMRSQSLHTTQWKKLYQYSLIYPLIWILIHMMNREPVVWGNRYATNAGSNLLYQQ